MRSVPLQKWVRALLALLLVVSTWAWAQLLDDVDFRREGDDAVLQLRFAVPVQFQNVVVSSAGDNLQIFYTVLPSATRPDTLLPERQFKGAEGLPVMRITDDAVARDDDKRRKVTIQFVGPTQFVVRPGKRRQVIDVVLPGLGAKLQTPGELQQSEERNFVVVLQSSTNASDSLEGSIPASMQDLVVFTSDRVDNGQKLHLFNLGYFRTRLEAQTALARLQRRFPAARVESFTAPAAQAALVAAPPTTRAATPVPTATPVSAATPSPTPAPAPAPVAVAPAAPAAAAPASDVAPATAAAAPSTPSPAVQAQPAAATPARSATEVEALASQLMARATQAEAGGDFKGAAIALDALLSLPPNGLSRAALEQIGVARLKEGDRPRARAEFETFLKLYPAGADAERVRQYLQNLPAPEAAALTRTAAAGAAKGAPVSVVSGSLSSFYYGGQSKVRSQTFQDDPLTGLPVLLSDSDISAQDQSQILTSLDLNWRYRDPERDQRFVLRESYASDLMPHRPDRERLSAAYFEQRNFTNGTSFKIGRQSPSGGGVLYRFDGLQAGYRFAPKWKVNGVAGVPTDPLLEAKRHFYGLSVEAEALTAHTSGSVYFNEQIIDEQVDRSALGTELRYFQEGLMLSGQVDYDQVLQGLNTLSLQGSWISPSNASVNFLLDRRAVPLRSLGNALFYQDPTFGVTARSIAQLLQYNTLERLRSYVNMVTPFQSQAVLGFNLPLSERWQFGGNMNYTNVEEIKPVADILPNGQASTGDLYGLGLQLIGSNLYSGRDTHVFSLNFISGPSYDGQMLSYNNMTGLGTWQIEPSFRVYLQTDNTGMRMERYTPGIRLSWRPVPKVSIESEASYEMAETVRPTGKESSSRMFYYVGGRFDF